MQTQVNSIDQYIAAFPVKTQELLQKVRACIQKAAPEASEKISYAIPTFYLSGNLVHFAAFKNHIGFYPGAGGIAHFQKEINAYKSAKGSVQFPIDQPMPLTLITRIVKFRVQENKEKEAAKKSKKK